MGSRIIRIHVIGALALVLSGCATQMVEHDAHDSCAKQGKQAFIFDAKQTGIPLFLESASATYLCVGPDDVTHLAPAFGADAVSSANFQGAGIVSVTPGSVAAKAGLRSNDIVYEIAGHPIASAADLRTEVNSVAPGDRAIIKFRRNHEKDTTVSAQF